MKKTVTANIAGTVFHIEEDAYDRLQRYLAGIRANFGGNAAEIMGDIESRIAELFNARLINRSVVTLEDVEHVESVMGRPEDFAGEGAPGVPPPGATGSKRFLRDPDDKWLGGVLGGLGAYLGMDPLWLRIAVIVLVMASVGSVIPLYLLLWILVPRADSAADRLRMRGEPVTVENIKRTVEEGASRFAKEAGDLGKDWGPRARDWGQAAGAQMRNAGSGARHALRRFVGLALVVIGFGMFLSLVTGWVGSSMSLWHFATWNNDGMGLLELGQLAFNSRTQAVWAGIGLFVLLAVPVIGLLLSGFNLLLNTRAPGWLGWSLAVIWIAALIPLAMACVDVGRDFRRGSTARTDVPIATPAGNILYLDALANANTNSDRGPGLRIHDDDIDVDLDGIYVENGIVYGPWADLDTEPSPDSLYHLEITRKARGRSTKEALLRAERITFETRQEGDVLFVSPVVSFSTEDKLRGQDAHFTLRLPMGGSVFFRPGSADIIYDIDNVTNMRDDRMIGRAWTMTPEGLREKSTLQVPDGKDHEVKPDSTAKPVTTASSRDRSPRQERYAPVVGTRTAHLPSLVALLQRIVTI